MKLKAKEFPTFIQNNQDESLSMDYSLLVIGDGFDCCLITTAIW